jgi:2-methylfumaryl-CoA isomerase
LEPWFKKRTISDVRDIFNNAKLTWSRFRSLKEAMQFDDDLNLKNPLFQNVNQPGIGQHLVPTHPAKFSEFDRKNAEKAPILGAHTEEILLEVMKLPEAEVASLFDNRIVAGPNCNV